MEIDFNPQIIENLRIMVANGIPIGRPLTELELFILSQEIDHSNQIMDSWNGDK